MKQLSFCSGLAAPNVDSVLTSGLEYKISNLNEKLQIFCGTLQFNRWEKLRLRIQIGSLLIPVFSLLLVPASAEHLQNMQAREFIWCLESQIACFLPSKDVWMGILKSCTALLLVSTYDEKIPLKRSYSKATREPHVYMCVCVYVHIDTHIYLLFYIHWYMHTHTPICCHTISFEKRKINFLGGPQCHSTPLGWIFWLYTCLSTLAFTLNFNSSKLLW